MSCGSSAMRRTTPGTSSSRGSPRSNGGVVIEGAARQGFVLSGGAARHLYRFVRHPWTKHRRRILRVPPWTTSNWRTTGGHGPVHRPWLGWRHHFQPDDQVTQPQSQPGLWVSCRTRQLDRHQPQGSFINNWGCRASMASARVHRKNCENSGLVCIDIPAPSAFMTRFVGNNASSDDTIDYTTPMQWTYRYNGVPARLIKFGNYITYYGSGTNKAACSGRPRRLDPPVMFLSSWGERPGEGSSKAVRNPLSSAVRSDLSRARVENTCRHQGLETNWSLGSTGSNSNRVPLAVPDHGQRIPDHRKSCIGNIVRDCQWLVVSTKNRRVRPVEGLTDDEMVFFDLLRKDDLDKASRERVKQASRGLPTCNQGAPVRTRSILGRREY